MSDTRQHLTDSWRAFLRNATPAVLAGYYLDRAKGDASLALHEAPTDTCAWRAE